MTTHHLTQINIAQCRDELTSDTMKAFVARLDEINALADQSPGFIWRWQPDESDDSASTIFKDRSLIINMSVWEDMEALRHYVYKSMHVELVRDREQWFHKLSNSYQVLWWIPEGSLPTPAEAYEKLQLLDRQGASTAAFTFAKSFPRP